MSEEQDQDQKTEAPSQKRLDEARAKGQVAIAPETRQAAMFLAAMVLTGGMLATMAGRLRMFLVALIERSSDHRLDPAGATTLFRDVGLGLGAALAPVFALLLIAALAGGLLQGRPTISWARLAPKWSKFSPMQNLKRILGPAEFLKTLAKFGVVLTAGVVILLPDIMALERSLLTNVGGIIGMAQHLFGRLLLAVTMIVLGIALIDTLYQRHAFTKRMRMTRQEVKEEHKNSEGDPHIKAKVRAIQRQRSRRRMLAAVPQASVVITNPTHYAVALRYDHGESRAPVVVAKGVDELAARIREAARAHDVPLVENPPLARALHATVEVDQEVPPEHYVAVAQVISFVMRLRERAGGLR